MENNIHNEIKTHQSPETGKVVTMIKTGPLEWESLDTCDKVPLTESEKLRVSTISYDQEKLAKIKKYAIQGNGKAAIVRITKISLSTVKRYWKLLDKETLEQITNLSSKNRQKPVKNPSKTKNGSCILLIINDFASHDPILIIIVLLPLFCLVGHILHQKRKAYLEEKDLWLRERGRIHKIFCTVLDLRFSRDVIVCSTQKQAAYYKKLLAHYSNGGREVAYLPIKNGESNNDYDYRAENYRSLQNFENRLKIKQGEINKKKATLKMEEENMLDYIGLGTYKYRNWFLSKMFILSYCHYYMEHPEPTVGNYKQKQLV